MNHFDEFQDELRAILPHLYSPTYPFPGLLAMVLGVEPRQGVDAVQAALRQSIRDLEPAADVPRHATIRRLHQIMLLRYIEQATQEEAAERLAITVRHLARQQAQAIDVLAQHLWNTSPARDRLAGTSAPEAGGSEAEDRAFQSAATRQRQVEQELTSLREHAPASVTHVDKALREVVSLTSVLASQHGLILELAPVEPGIVAAVHPSVLRQTLVATITYLVRAMTSGPIEISVMNTGTRTGARIEIRIAGKAPRATPPPAGWLGRDLLVSLGGPSVSRYPPLAT